MIERIKDIIKNSSTEELSNLIIQTYVNIEKEYLNRKWKYSELESGHFVEAIRRFIDFKLFSLYTPLSQSIGSFNNSTLNKYEQASGPEEYRIIVPRVLFSIYCIRNKRGVGHISSISPNHQDAIYILMSCKWILAEIIRIESSTSPETTIALIDKITQRQIDVIWDQGDVKRILIDNLSIKEKILIHLYDQGNLLTAELLNFIECKNKTYFRKILNELHANRLIEHIVQEGRCKISPKGETEAENIIMGKMEKTSL